MKSQSMVLPDEAVDAIKSGDVIEAVKIVRERTGLGLKEAKEAVDAFRDGNSKSLNEKQNGKVTLKAVAFLESGNLLDAIKETRQATGLGLKESKELVERFLVDNPSIRERFVDSADVGRGKVILNILILAAIVGAVYAILKWLNISV